MPDSREGHVASHLLEDAQLTEEKKKRSLPHSVLVGKGQLLLGTYCQEKFQNPRCNLRTQRPD